MNFCSLSLGKDSTTLTGHNCHWTHCHLASICLRCVMATERELEGVRISVQARAANPVPGLPPSAPSTPPRDTLVPLHPHTPFHPCCFWTHLSWSGSWPPVLPPTVAAHQNGRRQKPFYNSGILFCCPKPSRAQFCIGLGHENILHMRSVYDGTVEGIRKKSWEGKEAAKCISGVCECLGRGVQFLSLRDPHGISRNQHQTQGYY